MRSLQKICKIVIRRWWFCSGSSYKLSVYYVKPMSRNPGFSIESIRFFIKTEMTDVSKIFIYSQYFCWNRHSLKNQTISKTRLCLIQRNQPKHDLHASVMFFECTHLKWRENVWFIFQDLMIFINNFNVELPIFFKLKTTGVRVIKSKVLKNVDNLL